MITGLFSTFFFLAVLMLTDSNGSNHSWIFSDEAENDRCEFYERFDSPMKQFAFWSNETEDDENSGGYCKVGEDEEHVKTFALGPFQLFTYWLFDSPMKQLQFLNQSEEEDSSGYCKAIQENPVRTFALVPFHTFGTWLIHEFIFRTNLFNQTVSRSSEMCEFNLIETKERFCSPKFSFFQILENWQCSG